jgi:hypothetical protein
MAGNFNLDDYVQVNERIEKFYEKYPEGSIQTEIVSNGNGEVIIKAYAYRNSEDKHPTTGHAMEKEGSSFINKTSHIENCETSAVGRALAMMGFEIKKSVASREEVANAKLNQDKDPYTPPKAPQAPPQQENGELISKPQANRIFALSGSNADICKEVLKTFGYTKSDEVKKTHYEAICKAVQEVSTRADTDKDKLPWKD